MEVYEKLAERMNRFSSKMPPGPALFALLRELYPGEEAEVAANFPVGSYTARDLAGILGKEETRLVEILEVMANEGKMFSRKTGTGGYTYELAPWVPGVVEFSILRRKDPAEIDKLHALMLGIKMEGLAHLAPLLGNSEAMKAMQASLPPRDMRTIPIDASLSSTSSIYPYEDLLSRVEKETSFSAMPCSCRHISSKKGEPCKIHDIPEYSCLFFGEAAEYIIDRNIGRRITKEECKEILKKASKAGLVHNTNNFSEGVQFVCNCCPCCCGGLQASKTVGNIMIAPSNFFAAVAVEECTGCGACVERCPVDAIALKEDVAVVNRIRCLGCGNCVVVCPVNCISMARHSDKEPVIGDRKMGLGY